MSEMSAQALRSAVVNEAIANADFRAALAKDATAAIEEKFGKQPAAIHLAEEQDNEMSLLIPAKTDQLAQSFERFVKDLGERSPTRSEFEVVLVHRMWNDSAFATQLRQDARAALNDLLQKYGTSVPEGMTLRVYEEQPGECLIVIPRPVALDAELSEAELEAVAGGEGVALVITGAVVGAVAGSIATVIADRIVPELSSDSAAMN